MAREKQQERKWLVKAVVAGGWLLVWQLISLWTDNSILLVGPFQTFRVLVQKVGEGAFWQSVFTSLLRISAGFAGGWILGLVLAAISAGCKWIEESVKPVMILMKTVPVASFVVLFLIWFRTDVLAVAVSLSVVLPNVYLSTLEGIGSTDKKLLEMARVYRFHPLDCFFYIYRPGLKPFWNSCMKLCVGMSWKSGVAAEVIGTPRFSVGEQLYMSKIHLDTAGVLAWTVTILSVSLLCEKILMRGWHAFMEWQPVCKGAGQEKERTRTGEAELLVLREVSKTYNNQCVLDSLNAVYERGKVYYFRTPSGSGKTTLFRLLADLEQPDKGSIERKGRISFAFQEERLCQEYSALKNVELVTGDRDKACVYLQPLLTSQDMEKRCSELSGGMKRRVEVARAFAGESDIVLLDEPFAGLDEENRKKLQDYLNVFGGDKAILIASHI